MNYIAQKQNTTCFVIACANALVYLKRPIPDLEPIFDIACCRTGSTINPQAVVDVLKLPLKKTSDCHKVYRYGGILTIMHPICNLHAVFIAPAGWSTWGKKRRYITAVNSWLGPLEYYIEAATMNEFLPPKHVRNHWYFTC